MAVIHHLLHRWVRYLLALTMLLHVSLPAGAAEMDEYSVFVSGFSAFQQQDYRGAVDKMTQYLKQYPETPLRDMALFWLARAHFRIGNKQDAARYMAQFFRENPDSPLKNSVEEELVLLAQGYEKGERIAVSVEKPKSALLSEKQPAVVTAAAPKLPGKPGGEQAKTVTSPRPATKVAEEGRRQRSAENMKKRAITEYRSVQDKYPGTKAAAVAAERLKALGDAKRTAAEAIPAAQVLPPGKDAGVVSFEVGQYAAAEFSLQPYGSNNSAASRVSIPFEIVNRGNDTDRFLLESSFPPEFQAGFFAAGTPGSPITETSPLAAGESFTGVLQLSVPTSTVDGQKSTYPIRIMSKFDPDFSLSREVSLVTQAPLLRMVVKPDKEVVAPGKTVTYRIALLNVGSAAAGKVFYSIAYPPQYEPVEPLPRGFRKELKAFLLSDEMAVGSGENKEFSVSFRLKEEALAGQELFCRAELTNQDLRTKDTFLSAMAVVGSVNGVAVRSSGEKLVAMPGQRLVIPITVANTGNVRESFLLKPSFPPNVKYAFFRAGVTGTAYSGSEAVSASVGPLSPREEASLKLEISAPVEVDDNATSDLTVSFEPEGDRKNSATLTLQLTFSRPRVELELSGKGGRLKPGEISRLELNVVNRGSNLAKDLEVRSTLPAGLDIVASEPAASDVRNADRVWKFAELGPGERRTIVLAFKVKPTVAAGTSIRIENALRYKDQLGNTY